jgi:hypothetical protein
MPAVMLVKKRRQLKLPRGTVMVESNRKDQNTAAFLRMAALQLRQLAEHAPDIASELRHMAGQLESEADDLTGGDPE